MITVKIYKTTFADWFGSDVHKKVRVKRNKGKFKVETWNSEMAAAYFVSDPNWKFIRVDEDFEETEEEKDNQQLYLF